MLYCYIILHYTIQLYNTLHISPFQCLFRNHLCCSWGQQIDIWKWVVRWGRPNLYSVYLCGSRTVAVEGCLKDILAESWLTCSSFFKLIQTCQKQSRPRAIVRLGPAKGLHIWKMAALGLLRGNPVWKACVFTVSVSIKRGSDQATGRTKKEYNNTTQTYRNMTILIGQRSKEPVFRTECQICRWGSCRKWKQIPLSPTGKRQLGS